MNVQLLFFIVIFLLIWCAVLTILFLQFYFYYGRLSKNGKKESLVKLLDGIVGEQVNTKKALDGLANACAKLNEDGLLHIQKVGLLRFNPFKDTGGDQSFILALVDATDTGVIISSLHTRTGTRWYAKHVIGGKGTEYELSREEEEALKSAKVHKKKT
ncbi:MAG: DUF4446 family protein [Candidatus Levyibacteriota bacterium]